MPAQWLDVPLIGPADENVEEIELDQWASTIVDAIPLVVEGKLHLMKRPGLTNHINLGTNLPVDGLYWWDKKQVVVSVSDGRVWVITDSTGTKTEYTGSTDLLRGALVRFATDGTKLVMANGGRMVHTVIGGPLTTMADPDAPIQVSHVAFLDQYILANELNSGRAHFSGINDLTNWAALDIFGAESDPDDLLAMQVGFREVIMLGNESVEFWINDGVTPFSRISGSAQPYGTSAPYSLTLVGGTWMWLSDKRQLVTMQGRQTLPVSSPYDRVIQRFQSVNDAVGYTVSIDGHFIYLLNFPSARTTLAYNFGNQQWHKWGYWDMDRAIYQRYRGQSYCYAKAWNQHLVGDYANGMIYRADRSTFTDAGNPIRTLLRTGHISHGAEVTKRSNIFRLRCKRGLANSAIADPQVSLRRRVNNKAQWSNERWKSLGRVGEHELTIDWRRNGVYKTCQYEIVHSDPSDFVITGAKEHIDLLGK